MILDINYVYKNKRLLMADVGQFKCYIRQWKKPEGFPYCASVYSKKLKLFVYKNFLTRNEAIQAVAEVVAGCVVGQLNMKSLVVSSTINNQPIDKE